MMSKLALGSWIGLTTVAGQLLGAPNDWQVVVRPAQVEAAQGGGLYWVGLRNNAARPRAFCVLGVRFVFKLADGTTLDRPSTEYPSVGSPHPCASTIGHLVLPGETHFVMVQVERPRNVANRGAPRFWITAEETCVDEKPCSHSPIVASEADTLE